MAEMVRLKKLAGGQDRKLLQRKTINWAWITAVFHHLNGTELYLEEFQDHIFLRYGMMTQEISATYNGCGKKFSIDHAISFP